MPYISSHNSAWLSLVVSVGCTYSSDVYEINTFGDCCEKQCYATDDSGDECNNEASGGIRPAAYSLTLLFLLLGVMVL